MTTAGGSRYETGVALVAGGSGGLGAAICEALAKAGSDVALTYNRNAGAAEATAKRVREAGRQASVTQLDLANEDEVARFVAGARDAFGAIHTVVYAAGPYVAMRYVSRLDSEEFRQTVSTDIFGAYHLIHAALPHLRESRGVLVALTTTATRRYAVKDIMSVAPKAAV
ncbi:MAG TPA: SDR family NAD(P)-dependent oxidoreductase, partial [Caulobacteraceae bacterium]|nr:SDR family NAD(P)-dependent oxidoreductase [Caulobacteraceae bacterium]